MLAVLGALFKLTDQLAHVVADSDPGPPSFRCSLIQTPIAVTPQFFQHSQPEDLLLRRVICAVIFTDTLCLIR
jgi:hypothetical protein